MTKKETVTIGEEIVNKTYKPEYSVWKSVQHSVNDKINFGRMYPNGNGDDGYNYIVLMLGDKIKFEVVD